MPAVASSGSCQPWGPSGLRPARRLRAGSSSARSDPWLPPRQRYPPANYETVTDDFLRPVKNLEDSRKQGPVYLQHPSFQVSQLVNNVPYSPAFSEAGQSAEFYPKRCHLFPPISFTKNKTAVTRRFSHQTSRSTSACFTHPKFIKDLPRSPATSIPFNRYYVTVIPLLCSQVCKWQKLIFFLKSYKPIMLNLPRVIIANRFPTNN